MEIVHGWKPLPVILKIIWILILARAAFAIIEIIFVYNAGYELIGIPIYGLIAVNLQFFLDMALPVLLLVAMMKRYRWTWIFSVGFFIFLALNSIFEFRGLEGKMAASMAQIEDMQETPGMDPAYIRQMMYWIFVAIIILRSLINLAIAITFIWKRKYFSAPVPLNPMPPPESV